MPVEDPEPLIGAVKFFVRLDLHPICEGTHWCPSISGWALKIRRIYDSKSALIATSFQVREQRLKTLDFMNTAD
jgi:hypothetical protein